MDNIKVLIVDDERLHREGIRFLLNKMQSNLYIVSVENGRRAIEAIEKESFHLIITDIKMPIMDGLELIHYIRQNNMDVHIVICSAHSDFEYARKALQNEVYDYLIKPINRAEFKDLMEKIQHTIMMKIKKERIELERAVFQMLYGKPSQDFDAFMNKLLWFEEDYYSILLIYNSLKFDSNHVDTEHYITNRIDSDSIYVNINEYESVILKHHKKMKDNTIKDHYQKLYERLVNKKGQHFLFMMSTIFKSRDRIASVFHEIKDIVDSEKYKNNYTLLFHDELFRDYQYDNDIIEQKIHIIMHNIAYNNVTQVKESLVLFFNELYKVDYSLIFIKYIICEIAKKIMEKFQTSQDVEKVINYVMASKDINNVQEKILSLIGNEEEKNNQHEKYIIEILDYIHEHYHEDISLDVLANQIYLSPSYVSMMFKRAVGQNLTEYIINYRMEKAKKMVQTTNKKISQISKEVGYTNIPYFTTLFKKYYGQTPSKLRKASE